MQLTREAAFASPTNISHSTTCPGPCAIVEGATIEDKQIDIHGRVVVSRGFRKAQHTTILWVETGHHVTAVYQICHWSPWTPDSIGTMTVRDTIGIVPMIEGPSTTTVQRQTTGGIPKLFQIHIMILPQ